MICPVDIARDVSASQAARVRDDGRHVLLHEGRDGAGDENTGSVVASDGEEDHVVSGGRIIGISDRHMRRSMIDFKSHSQTTSLKNSRAAV
jgi:hypothetical protein